MRGLRSNICSSHEPLGRPFLIAHLTRVIAPMINNQRISRGPIHCPSGSCKAWSREGLMSCPISACPGGLLDRDQPEPRGIIASSLKALQRWGKCHIPSNGRATTSCGTQVHLPPSRHALGKPTLPSLSAMQASPAGQRSTPIIVTWFMDASSNLVLSTAPLWHSLMPVPG
jgi:hypothetical protein